MPTTTFLFVDQVRSTEQLTRLGDTAAHDVRRALFDLLRQATQMAGGHEVDFTGDGLFCAFGGAAEAVDAAVSMQQLAWSFNQRQPEDRRLGVRIGLNTGEPLESEGGGYFGAAVVVAARLCAAAEEGQILAADVVRSLVEARGVHTFAAIGPLSLKGVPEPVPVVTVTWQPDERRAELPAPLAAARSGLAVPPFVGRERETAAVRTAWDAVRGGARRLVLVSGDQGIGVSRFLAESAHALRADGATVWYGEGAGPGARLAPWSEALTAWAESTSRAELRLALGSKAADLLRLAPGLERLVPRLPAPPPMDRAAELFLIADALDELLRRWSAHEPLVVVLDRLEEADQDSLTVLRRLAESPREGRVLLLAGYEPAQIGTPRVLAAVGELPELIDLRLSGLSEDEVHELVARVTDEPVPAQSLTAVLRESEGNPFFVLQMARALRERSLTHQVHRAVDRAEALRTDLRLQREEIALGLRQLEQLRAEDVSGASQTVEPDGTPPAPVECPYKGLVAFQPSDADDFFGRDMLVAELVARLVSSRFLAVVGPSGSGKSSAVRAGLLPALAKGAVPPSDRWVSAVCAPGASDVSQVLEEARQRSRGQGIVLVVDQFEELWTAVDPQARADALDLLVRSATDSEQQVVVVVVLRADYYGQIAEHPGFAELVAESQVVVSPMTHSELRAAIEGPARRVGLLLEPGLAQAVIDDVGDEPGGLPLLSTALLETWHRRRGRSLTLAAYAETGGARRAIAQLADATFDELTPDEQHAARRVLERLAAPAANGDDVSRPVPLAELAGDEVAQRVLARLVDRRLVTTGQSTAQVAHEALLREWPRLRRWLDADREGRRLHQQIATAAVEWNASGRDEGALLRGARLAAAEDWRAGYDAELTELEQAYVSASIDARQGELRRARRTARRFQLLAGGLVVLLVGALVAGGFALAQRQAAAQRADQAAARSLAAQAIALSGTNADTALVLAAEGYRIDPSIDTESGLLTALNGARYLVGYHRTLPLDVADIALSPDGKTLYAITTKGELRGFDTATWRPSGDPIAVGIREPGGVTLTSDGRRLAYGASDGVHVVDPASGRQVGVFGGSGGFSGGAFNGTGTVLVTGVWSDPAAHVFDVASGREIGVVRRQESPTFAVNPRQDEMVVGSAEGSAVRRYGFDGKPRGPQVELSQLGRIWGAAYSRAGTRIAVSGLYGVVQIVDATTLDAKGVPITLRGSRPVDVSFSPSDRLVGLSADDGSVRVAETATGTVVATIAGLSGGALVEFLDENRVLVVTASEAAEFDLRRTTALGRTSKREQPVLAVVPSSSSDVPAVIVEDTRVVGMSPDLHEGAAPLPAPTGKRVDGIVFSPDGRLAAVYGSPSPSRQSTAQDGGTAQVTLVDVGTHRAVRTVPIPSDVGNIAGIPPGLAFSPDASRLAVGTPDGSLYVLRMPDGGLVAPAHKVDREALAAVAWSADGAMILAAGQQGVLHYVDPVTARTTFDVPLSPEVQISGAAAVPGTQLVAFSSLSGQVFLVDVAARRVDGEPLSGGGTQLQGVDVSPDGSRIVATTRDGAVRIWDRATRRSIGPPLAAHDVQALGIAFLDDHRLMTGGYDGSVVSWDLEPSSWLATACRLAGRDLTEAEWRQYLPDRPYRRTCAGVPAAS
jgi:class 3 adenylate cyclase/WD40 repeat protein